MYNIINEFKSAGLVDFIRGSSITEKTKISSFGDAEITSIVAGNMADNPILLLTQDKKLAAFICSMNYQNAITGPGVKVKRVSNGRLEKFELKHALLDFGYYSTNKSYVSKNRPEYKYSVVGEMVKELVARENIKNSNNPRMNELKRILRNKVLTWRESDFVRVASEYSVEPNVDRMVEALLASLNKNEQEKILAQIDYTEKEQRFLPNKKASTVDEKLRLTAELVKGAGRYKKGILWNKKDFLNFKLRIDIENREELKISSIFAEIRCGVYVHKQKVSNGLTSETEFDLPTYAYSGNIEAIVKVKYKIGAFKSKEITAKVSNKF